jgi:hypothetical protein
LIKKLIHYFERHIEIDADEHRMAMKMITELCGDDEQNGQKLKEIIALDRRIGLWDAEKPLQ